MLRDAIGTARGIEGVLVATAASGPMPIRPELETMAHRLQREPLDVVLDGLAADLDHPLGDLVVTALRLTSTAGGSQIRDVFNSLAVAAYAEAESHRRVEVASERPRAAMRYTAIIIGGFVIALSVFSRRYLEPYGCALGQVILAFVAMYWALGFWWMNRMGRPEPVERFLAKAAAGGTPIMSGLTAAMMAGGLVGVGVCSMITGLVPSEDTAPRRARPPRSTRPEVVDGLDRFDRCARSGGWPARSARSIER